MKMKIQDIKTSIQQKGQTKAQNKCIRNTCWLRLSWNFNSTTIQKDKLPISNLPIRTRTRKKDQYGRWLTSKVRDKSIKSSKAITISMMARFLPYRDNWKETLSFSCVKESILSEMTWKQSRYIVGISQKKGWEKWVSKLICLRTKK